MSTTIKGSPPHQTGTRSRQRPRRPSRAKTPAARIHRPRTHAEQPREKPSAPASTRENAGVGFAEFAYSQTEYVETLPRLHRPRREAPRIRRFFRGFSFEKLFTLVSFLVAITLIAVCVADLTTAWPWMKASPMFDWCYLLAGCGLLCLTINTFFDQS
ncbi:hypothetical protein [Aporhodopirellula aestuarii]|uniref:Transmembrane protein n=1 Tax=Aporhodopirellula aestuarii TaxID=2950107 RepID=A0ABT0UBG5_9BACT|nr:hypothetical protein [Aporhodopirellula aestuarii]MCM2373676.1 hypothetical protein [Aporhodopirellula aestuarii]